MKEGLTSWQELENKTWLLGTFCLRMKSQKSKKHLQTACLLLHQKFNTLKSYSNLFRFSNIRNKIRKVIISSEQKWTPNIKKEHTSSKTREKEPMTSSLCLFGTTKATMKLTDLNFIPICKKDLIKSQKKTNFILSTNAAFQSKAIACIKNFLLKIPRVFTSQIFSTGIKAFC